MHILTRREWKKFFVKMMLCCVVFLLLSCFVVQTIFVICLPSVCPPIENQ
jgi:hypothetical protein